MAARIVVRSAVVLLIESPLFGARLPGTCLGWGWYCAALFLASTVGFLDCTSVYCGTTCLGSRLFISISLKLLLRASSKLWFTASDLLIGDDALTCTFVGKFSFCYPYSLG